MGQSVGETGAAPRIYLLPTEPHTVQRGVTVCEMLPAQATGFSLGAGHVGTLCLELANIPDSQEASSSAGQSGHRDPLLLGNTGALLGFRLADASHGPPWGQDSRFDLSINNPFCINRRCRGGRLWGKEPV